MAFHLASTATVSGVTPEPVEGRARPHPETQEAGERFARTLSQARQAGGPRAFEAQVVRPARTPLSGDQAAAAISKAWQELNGETPNSATLSILTAHWAHETGNGAHMYNYNFGGIKGISPEGLTASYRTREGFGESERRITDRFRAYGSAEAGARDYLALLENRYPDAVRAAREEDPAGFVDALRRRGYFTGDPTAYTRNVTRLANQAMASGYEAIGGVRGPIEGASSSEPYFAMPIEGPLAAEHSGASPFATIPLADPGASAVIDIWDVLALSDEVSRAALRIAASDARREESDS